MTSTPGAGQDFFSSPHQSRSGVSVVPSTYRSLSPRRCEATNFIWCRD